MRPVGGRYISTTREKEEIQEKRFSKVLRARQGRDRSVGLLYFSTLCCFNQSQGREKEVLELEVFDQMCVVSAGMKRRELAFPVGFN